jgi:hypothetical protein
MSIILTGVRSRQAPQLENRSDEAHPSKTVSSSVIVIRQVSNSSADRASAGSTICHH